MDLAKMIMTTYPELTNDDFNVKGCIELRDDGDGIAYIYKWDYSKPIPEGLSLGKP